MARKISQECRCNAGLTCGHCLKNAPPAIFTPRSSQEILASQIREIGCWGDIAEKMPYEEE
jgi:hypothetical protein